MQWTNNSNLALILIMREVVDAFGFVGENVSQGFHMTWVWTMRMVVECIRERYKGRQGVSC